MSKSRRNKLLEEGMKNVHQFLYPNETPISDNTESLVGAFRRPDVAPSSTDILEGAKKSSPDNIAPPKLDTPKTPSLPTDHDLARTMGSLGDMGSLPNLSAHPLIQQAETLTYRKGHTRHNHDFWDSIISQLPGNEQNVYSWLYRFREGNSNITIILSLPTLAARCGVDEKTVGRVIKRLTDKGFVRDHSSHFGKGRAQGKRFWVYVPTALVSEQLSPDKMGSLPKTSPIIDKELKENNKRGNELSLDTKSCPDCQGSGFYYPEGIEKGVAKCKHEGMGK